MSSAAAAAPSARLAAPRTRPSAAQQQRDAAASGDGRRSDRAPSLDPLSEKATLMLIRRVLCPQKLAEKGRDAVPPIEELLPSLTSRNDVDLQLYAFLAIIIREFVQAWYNKITPDETFVAEVLQVIAHCSRALEQRFRTLDVESLVLDEIPDLLDRHITAYRASHDPVSEDPTIVNSREVYHALFPLPQLSPVPQADDEKSAEEQKDNEAAYRQLLVQAVLAILLPTEDLENPCLTAIVGQIFSELIVGNIIAGKASQPWLLFESICIAGRVLGEKKSRATQRMVSGRHTPPVKAKGKKECIKWSAQAIFLTMVHVVVMVFSSVRLLITTLVASSSLPLRQMGAGLSSGSKDNGESSTSDNEESNKPTKVPVLNFKVWQCVGNLIQLDTRMPWLSGFLSLVQYQAVYGPGRLAGLNSPLDRRHEVQLLEPGAQNNIDSGPPDEARPEAGQPRCILVPRSIPRHPLCFVTADNQKIIIFDALPMAARKSPLALPLIDRVVRPNEAVQPCIAFVRLRAELCKGCAPLMRTWYFCILGPLVPWRTLSDWNAASSDKKPYMRARVGQYMLLLRGLVQSTDKDTWSLHTGEPGAQDTFPTEYITLAPTALDVQSFDLAYTRPNTSPKLLSHYIQQMFAASHLPGVLRTLRGVLFPNNAPGKSSLAPPSSDEEFVALRKRAAGALLGLLPASVARVYFGGVSAAAQRDGMEELFMVLNDDYCNKHLMYSVLELILVRLMPELSEKGVGELWEERLG
ncbi:hypothetical protein PWT90_04298 [Aphanocladium album]|nr:hypothetical protein PWT90_04298 [Aphanocladium album]